MLYLSLSIKTITWVNKCLLNINTTFRTSWRQTSFWPASSTSPVNGVSLTWANLQVGHQCQASGLYISPLKYTNLCYFSAPHSACQFVVNFTTPTCLLYFFKKLLSHLLCRGGGGRVFIIYMYIVYSSLAKIYWFPFIILVNSVPDQYYLDSDPRICMVTNGYGSCLRYDLKFKKFMTKRQQKSPFFHL